MPAITAVGEAVRERSRIAPNLSPDPIHARTAGDSRWRRYYDNAHGFSLHAAVRTAAPQRKELERLSRYITRPAIANERLSRNAKGQVVLQLKSPYRDGTTHIVMSAQENSCNAWRPWFRAPGCT